MALVATIADVARAAGVSIATVSRVLSPGPVPHPVRADTAERVRIAARELNFVPSPLARGLAARRSGLIGLIVPDLVDPYYPQIAGGVEEGARDAGLSVLICNTLGGLDRLRGYLQLLQARRVDAIVLAGGTSLNATELLAMQHSEVPVVLIGRPVISTPWPYVCIDNQAGGRTATRHLLQHGRRSVVHLGGPLTQTTMADRASGYRAALNAVGLKGDAIECNGTTRDGYGRLRDRLEDGRRERADAVFAATDRLAIAALGLAADCHLHVPRDLAIIGFDNMPVAAQLRPTLSTMDQPAHELGAAAVEMAQRLASGDEVESQMRLATLVARESTLGPGGRYVE
jgi:LacI family transcriptional regulator